MLAVFLSSAILRHGSPVLAEPGGKRPGKQCTPGTDSDSCDNYRYPVSNTVSGKVTYEREVCCNNGSVVAVVTAIVGTHASRPVEERPGVLLHRAGKICRPAGDETCCERNWSVRRVQISARGGITGSYRRR